MALSAGCVVAVVEALFLAVYLPRESRPCLVFVNCASVSDFVLCRFLCPSTSVSLGAVYVLFIVKFNPLSSPDGIGQAGQTEDLDTDKRL